MVTVSSFREKRGFREILQSDWTITDLIRFDRKTIIWTTKRLRRCTWGAGTICLHLVGFHTKFDTRGGPKTVPDRSTPLFYYNNTLLSDSYSWTVQIKSDQISFRPIKLQDFSKKTFFSKTAHSYHKLSTVRTRGVHG